MCEGRSGMNFPVVTQRRVAFERLELFRCRKLRLSRVGFEQRDGRLCAGSSRFAILLMLHCWGSRRIVMFIIGHRRTHDLVHER